MRKVIDFVGKKTKKHSKKFSSFLLIGIFKMPLSIGLTWLFIDILQIQALLGSIMAVVTGFFLVYFFYVKTKVIKPALMKYASATIGFNIVNILLVWVLVDFVGLSGALSSTIVIGLLFIFRYVFFSKIGLIQYEKD